MAGNEKTCPLCDLPASVDPAQYIVGDKVDCDRCGKFRIEYGALQGFEKRRHLISGRTRRLSQASPPGSQRLTLTADNIPDLLAGVRLNGLLDQLDLALVYVGEHQTRADQHVEYRELAAKDYPLAYARDEKEFLYFLQTLASQSLLEGPPGSSVSGRTSFRLTPDGWQRIRELGKVAADPDRAFAAMWFSPDLKPAWENGIKPALEDLKYKPIRIDATHGSDKIDDRIIAEIRRSGLLVADFTGHRGGVYFEAGLAMGLGIPVVWTCRKEDHKNTHFDTRQYQFLLWDEPADLREKLVNHIASRIPGRMLPPRQ